MRLSNGKCHLRAGPPGCQWDAGQMEGQAPGKKPVAPSCSNVEEMANGQQGGADVKASLVGQEPSLGAGPSLHLEENAQQSDPSC